MNLKRHDLIAVIFFSVILTLVGAQGVFSFTGTMDVISPGALEITDINATNYYKNDISLNERLEGDWGSINLETTGYLNVSEYYLNDVNVTAVFEGNFTGTDFVVSTLDTGQGAHELYDMDQDVLEASAVTFDTVDTGHGANELYDMDQHVLQASAVTFSSLDTGYVNSTEYYWNDVNRTDTLAFPEQSVSYTITKDGSVYYAKNGSTGQRDFSSTSLEAIVEWADTSLTGGGIIELYGPSEIWIVDDRIDAQNEYVTIEMDWSLTLKAKDSLNDAVFYNDNVDNYEYRKIHIHGNNESNTDGWGIKVWKADNVKIIEPFIEHVVKFGVWVYGTASDIAYNPEVRNGRFLNNSWNHIQIGGYADFGVVDGNYGNQWGDVGIAIMGWFNVITNNRMINATMPTGASVSHYAYACESYGRYGKFNIFDSNLAYDVDAGFVCTEYAEFNEWSNGIIINENVQVDDWDFMSWLQGKYNKISTTLFIDYSGADKDYAVKVTGWSNEVTDIRTLNLERGVQLVGNFTSLTECRYFENCTIAVVIDGGFSFIDDNDFILATNDVSDNVASTVYGYNRDQSGNWDEGIEP